MKLNRLFVTAAYMLLSVGTMMAQQMPQIPVDKNVKIGHLSNGLTYYIRHNNYPEHTASFYIAQKVGSINENDDQRGLAHLLEHLAFNGSDHFKGNSLQEYLQSIGVEYGRNLNAYTSVDQTVYYFTNVPTTRTTAVDSCMLILKDWSNGITLTKEAIEGERDVVHNEYRMRMVGQQRIVERALPKLYPNSKYGYRMPIGLMSVIDGCDPETLRAYYRKWYRPDNQAIIVVGDVDVDHIEAEIKKLFSDIKVPANAAKVIPEQVPDNNQAIYVVDKDKEQQYDMMLIMMKHDATPDSLKGGLEYMAEEYLQSVFSDMLDARFSEKAQDANCPYLQASSGIGEYMISRTKDCLSLTGIAKPGQVKEAYAAILRELKRVKDYGFTASEYQRAKDEFLSQQEKMYTNRDKMKNEQFTTQYVDNFISNEPIPSTEDKYQIYQMLAPNLPVEVVNEYAKELINETDTNFVNLIMMREVEGATYPTEQELADIVKQVRSEKLEAYVDNVKQEPLIAQAPKAGKIKSTKENTQLGYKELVLSNGAKVILKKTDFKDDEIRFYAQAKDGKTAFGKEDSKNYRFMDLVLSTSGLGTFSNNDLEKALAGKQASVQPWIGYYAHGLQGSTTPKDLETLVQLAYLNLTNISKDQKAFDNLKNTYATVLANQSKNPNMVYQDSLQSTIYMHNPLFRTPKTEDIEGINLDRTLELGKQLFYGKAKDYTFYFVGNFDESKLLPLIEQYFAALPNDKKVAKLSVTPYSVATGEIKNIFTKEMENPQSMASEVWQFTAPYSLKDNVTLNIASRVLEMDYNRNIRERLSAAYSAGAGKSLSRTADGKYIYTLIGQAGLNPDKVKEAIPCFFEGMKQATTAPNEGDLQKVKEILLKQADVAAKTNSYWENVLTEYVEYGNDIHTDYKSIINATDGKAVADFLTNKLLKAGNHFEVIMNAVKEK